MARSNTILAASMKSGTKTYGEDGTMVRALNKVSIDFEQGKFTAIMGPSGSGKSTLLQCIAGLDQLTSGKVTLGGKNITEMKDAALTKLRRDNVGFIFQAFNLIPTLTAKENITLPQTIAGNDYDQDWFDKVVKTLGLQDRLKHLPSELSGGQQQRVAAARALIARPEIVFADEPSGNLDSNSGRELLEFMRSAVDDFGQAIVMVTHDAHAASYADRVVFLDDGKIVDEMSKPTTGKILDKLKKLGG